MQPRRGLSTGESPRRVFFGERRARYGCFVVSGVTVFLGPVLGAGVRVVGVVVAGVAVVGAVVVVGCVAGFVPWRTPPAFIAAGAGFVAAGAVVAVDPLGAGAPGVATLPAADCVTVPPAEPQGLAAGLAGCDFFLLKMDAKPCTAVVAWATVVAPCCAAPCTACEPVAFATAVAVPAAPPLLHG